ncbi:MAG TPA: VWA domain-containing protein [Pyrinomonadaceae bacterium]|nr:VWA domain-containing protein [Pyrinomonadaceae bacterium]
MKLNSVFVCWLIILLGFVTLLAQEDEVIKVDSSLVVLNATITDTTGNPVKNLKKNQFKVLEDGKEQTISFFETETIPFAAVILIDTSGSMETRISIARAAAINFLDGLRIDDQVAIYNFDTKVSLVQEFSNSRDITPMAFELKAYGYTALNDAIFQAAEELGKRDEKRRAIIVLSDGADNKSANSADKALKAALASNATIYTVDMSEIDTGGRERMQNQGVLKNFAEKTGGKFLNTQGGVALREAFKNIVEELGVQYTLGYSPTNTTKDGKWRTLELQVAKPNLTIRTRKGYNAPKN